MCRIHQRTTDLWNRPSLLDSRMKQCRWVARVVIESEVAVGPVACLAAREASECTNDDEEIHIYNGTQPDAIYSKTLRNFLESCHKKKYGR